MQRVDGATNNETSTDDTVIQGKSKRKKNLGKPADSDPSSTTNGEIKPAPPKEGESPSLNNFRETLKEVLEEITSLEVNTMIVDKITMSSFDAKEFYLQLIEDVMYKTERGLEEVKESLLNRSTELKKKGALLPQQTRAPMLPKEAQIIDAYRAELTSYNHDLEAYKDAESVFQKRKEAERLFYDRYDPLAISSLDPESKVHYYQEKEIHERFASEQACYEQLSKQILKLNIPKNEATGEVMIDGKALRSLRKLWEFEQSVLNGDLIYAQTKFSLDGDLTNRYLNDLFIPSQSKIDPKLVGLVFDLHRQGVENAQKQWSGLIDTCIGLIKNLMQFRQS